MANWSEGSGLTGGGAFVGAFGKIPRMGDFVRVRAAGEPTASFEQWVEQGMGYGSQRRGSAWPGAYGAGPIYAFVFRGPRAARAPALLTGILKPSHDAVGRKFPLVVFAPVLERVVAGGPHLLPLALGDFLEAATQAVLDAETFTSLAQLESYVQRLTPPRLDQGEAVFRDYDHWTRTTYLQNAWLAIYGDPTAPSPIHAIHTIFEALGPFRGQEAPATPLSVRLPLGRGGGAAAGFWVDIVRRVARWRATVPTCFWSFDGQSGTLLVQLGDTPPSTLAELWSPDANSDHVCDLTVPASVDRARFLGRLPPHIAARLEHPQTVVAELLAALAQ